MFSNSTSLKPVQTSHSLVSDVVGSTAPPPTPERETFEEEVFNPDIVECHTDSYWRQKSNPLVHSFTEYYEQHNRK